MRVLSSASLACLFLSISVFSSCKNDDEQPQLAYPVTFTLNRVEFNPASFYEVGANAFPEVQPGGQLTLFEAFLQEDLQEEADDYFEFRSLELLSDTVARVEFYDFSSGSSDFIEVAYADQGSEIVLSGGGDQISFERNSAFDELRLCIFSYIGAYYDDFFQRRDVTGVTGTTCWEAPLESKLDSIRNDLNLAVGDTIGISTSYFIYE